MECQKCGHVNDESLDMKFAFRKLREMTTGGELAAAISSAGWTHELTPLSDTNESTWRIQAFHDADGAFVIAVHNGERWVAVYKDGPNYFPTEPVHFHVGTALDYLKRFEPNED